MEARSLCTELCKTIQDASPVRQVPNTLQPRLTRVYFQTLRPEARRKVRRVQAGQFRAAARITTIVLRRNYWAAVKNFHDAGNVCMDA